MFAKACLLLLLAGFIAAPAVSQVEPGATGGATQSPDDSQMMTPPPVSGVPYADTSVADARSNYLSASVMADAAYNDNIVPVFTAKPVSDEIYLISPDISLDRTAGRQKVSVRYSPTFSFYQHENELDTIDHSASLVYQIRPTPHVSVNIQDYFLRTSDVFNGSYPFSSGNLTGVAQAPVPALIAPYVEQMSDTANGTVSYQFGRNSMVGGGASYTTFSFPNTAAAASLSNSDGEGGSVFYARRLSGTQYAGLAYQYAREVVTDAPYAPFNIQLHSILPFYTIYFNPKFSLSLSGGIQHVGLSQLNVQGYTSWSGAGTASLGWQGLRGNFALSYLHSVITGEGFAEALTSDSVSASGGWKITRTWNSTLEVSYVNTSPVAQIGNNIIYGYEGGNALTLGARLNHTMGERCRLTASYDRLQENYPGIPFIAQNPISNSEFVTISYQFKKSLGR